MENRLKMKKGRSRRLGSGHDIALGRGDGSLDWVGVMDLVSFWVDDAKEATGVPGTNRSSQEGLRGV